MSINKGMMMRPRAVNIMAKRFVAGAAEVGLPTLLDYNAGDQIGAGITQAGSLCVCCLS